MAYKKYIQRNGKLYGPYIYESKRVDGKVVSEYHGSEEPKKVKGVKVHNYRKVFSIFIGVFLAAILIYFLFSIPSHRDISGNVILGVDSSYEKGKPLDGVLKFSLNDGELIPSSSKLIFENSGKTYEFPLNDVLKENPLEGNYYVQGKEISGNGQGYGLEGERVIYPEVNFLLQIYKEGADEWGSEQIISNETNGESNPAPITGNTVRSSGGFFRSLFGATGMVTMELNNEVEGGVSKEKPFSYELKEGEKAELKTRSVKVGENEVPENIISLNTEGNELIITTDYSEVEKGYGEDYLGKKEKTFSLDLSDLNLILDEGDLKINLVYENEDIFSLTTLLKEGEKTSNEVVNEPEQTENTSEIEKIVEIPSEVEVNEEDINGANETAEEIIDSSLWDISDFLTPQEKKVLSDNFENTVLKNIKSEIFKGRIIRVYEFGKYSVEYSYDASLNNDILEIQMERDRIKFLKDIANSFLKEEASSKTLEGFNETYTL